MSTRSRTSSPNSLPGLLATPVFALGGGPMLVINVSAFVTFLASGALTYWLAYAVTGHVILSLLAGMVDGFFTNRMDHLGQFTYQMAVLPPLILWLLHRVLRDARWRNVVLLVGALWAQALSGLYQLFGLAFALAGFLVAFLLLRPAAFTRRLVIRGTLALLLLAVAPVRSRWAASPRHAVRTQPRNSDDVWRPSGDNSCPRRRIARSLLADS